MRIGGDRPDRAAQCSGLGVAVDYCAGVVGTRWGGPGMVSGVIRIDGRGPVRTDVRGPDADRFLLSVTGSNCDQEMRRKRQNE